MSLIGLTGKAGCGKDTVGDLLKEKHDFSTTSFALPIKQMICVMLGVDMKMWDDREWREKPIPLYGDCSPRQMAQTLGTEWGRTCIKSSLWCDLALERVRNESPLMAITDVRFNNEAERIRNQGGYIVGVYREFNDLHPNARGHASEDGIDPTLIDYHVHNNGTLDDLEIQVARMAAVLAPEPVDR